MDFIRVCVEKIDEGVFEIKAEARDRSRYIITTHALNWADALDTAMPGMAEWNERA